MQFTLAALTALVALTAAAPVDSNIDNLIARHPVQPRQAVPSGGYANPTGTGISSPTGTGIATGIYPTGTAAGQPCSDNGAVLCNGPSMYGVCNWGRVVFRPVSQGTKCEDGVITEA